MFMTSSQLSKMLSDRKRHASMKAKWENKNPWPEYTDKDQAEWEEWSKENMPEEP